MGIDIELISTEGFNLKFKNRLRDFYIYQFKHNEKNFYDKGNLLEARMLAGCILIDKYNITKDEIFSLQMRHIEIDSDNGFICISLDDKFIQIEKPVSKIISLLYVQVTSAFFLTGNELNPCQKRYFAHFQNALHKYENLNHKDELEIIDEWMEIYLMSINDPVKYGTFRYDSTRLENILAPLVGVEWKNGDDVDLNKGVINPKKKNVHVKCVTVDGRTITDNPFFELYKHCDKSSTFVGQSFSLIYFLIFYFNIGNKIERYDYAQIKENDYKLLENCLISVAIDLESKARNSNKTKSWSDFSSKEKNIYGTKAIEKLSTEDDEIKRIYDYMSLHNKRVVLKNDRFVIEDNTLSESSFVEKNALFKVYNQYRDRHNDEEKIDIKQFGNNLYKLTQLGILKCKKSGDRLYYTLSDVFIKDILRNDEDLRTRFSEMISFFSQILPLGEVGNYILKRISDKPIQNIYYKHRYLIRSLNDYNLIDLLNAIEQKLFIEIEYRNATISDLKYQRFICRPLEIRESVTDGRQYLLYYHPEYRSVSAVRIDFIDSIKMGTIKEKDFFAEDMERAEQLIAYTWGTSFDGFRDGNVAKKIKTNRMRVLLKKLDKEFHIENRLLRESRNCISVSSITDETYGKCLEINAEIVDFKEMMKWLRSFTCRIISVEVNGVEYVNFYDGIIKMAKLYKLTDLSYICYEKQNEHKKETLLEIKNKLALKNNLHSLLFNEIFSEPFNRVGDILFNLLKEDVVDETSIKTKYSNKMDPSIAGDRIKQLDFVLRTFVLKGRRKKKNTIWEEYEDAMMPVFSLKKECTADKMLDLIPLTYVEIQWLLNILNHHFAKNFLSSTEIKMIKYSLPKMNLFDVNKVVLYDQFLGTDSFYQTLHFGSDFRKILQALREHRPISIEYFNQYGEKSEYICYPSHIEYSKRDNIIRVRGICNGCVKNFNVERIKKVDVCNETFDYNDINSLVKKYDASKECSITVLFREKKGMLNRILTEFSCFKINCIQWKNDSYKMTIFYHKDDAMEVLVRLLSYGSSIIFESEENNALIKDYFERIENQIELIKSREIVKTHIEKQKMEQQR